jgi:hypothetical protein
VPGIDGGADPCQALTIGSTRRLLVSTCTS